MAAFVGKWIQEEKKNMDEYLAAMGVPDSIIQMVKDNKDTLDISREGDTYTYFSTFGDLTNTVVFKVGTVTDYKTHHGQPMKGIIKTAGDKMIEEHYFGEEKTDITREIIDGKHVETMTSPSKGVTATLIYKRVA